MYFTFIIIALFGLASNLTPAGATNADLQLEYPGLQCIYNDYLYTDGQTIEVFRGACSKLVCRVVPSSFGIGFTSRIFLENLDRCQCSIITPRIPFPLVTLNKVIGAAENLVDKTVSNIVSNFYIGRDQGCYFNNTFVKMNEFVEHLPSKCALLQCNIHDGRPVIELFVKSICFCRATPDPTTTVTVTASPTVTATASPSPTSTTSSPGTTATTSTSTLPTVTVTATASPVPTSTVTITASPSSTTSSFPSSTITVTVTATPTSIITVTVTPTATTASSTSTTATTASSTSTTATTATSTSTTATTATTSTSTTAPTSTSTSTTAPTSTSTSTSTTAPTSTSTSTTATTATSTTNASATTSSISGFSRRAGLVAVEEDGGGCDAYSSVSTRHSMCLPPNQRCSVLASGVPAAAKKAIVAAHNSYRVKVARGWESRGLNGPQPEAANLYQLSWNEELARIAQAWAFQCQLLSDCYECRAPITRPYTFTGQNVHQLLAVSSRHSHSNRMNAAREWGIVIDSWYSEVAHVDENIVRSFTPVSQNQTIGHYTQMLWASTYEIGCGQVTFGPCVEFVNNAPAFREKCQIFVCNYGPAGNLITQPIYSIGPAASQCLHGPSQQFSELCSPKPSWN